jgi:hypothetical protein
MFHKNGIVLPLLFVKMYINNSKGIVGHLF